MHDSKHLGRLTAAARRSLAEIAGAPQAWPGQRKLIDCGRRHDSAFLVEEGWLAEYRLLRDGRRQILDFKLAGEITGLDGLARPVAGYSVKTLTRCRVVPLPLAALRQCVGGCPELASGLLLAALGDQALLHDWEVRLGRMSAYDRVAHLLRELHDRNQAQGPGAAASQIPITQADIADCTGLSVPYVNRILQQMRQEGLVGGNGRVLEIDMERFRAKWGRWGCHPAKIGVGTHIHFEGVAAKEI